MRTTRTTLALALAAGSALGVPSVLAVEPPGPAPQLEIGQPVEGDSRNGVQLGSTTNEFWRLPVLRARDRVTVRWTGGAKSAYCAYGPGPREFGWLFRESGCGPFSALIRPRETFVADRGPGSYVLGVFAREGGPYRLVVERIQRHLDLRFTPRSRLDRNDVVTVRVRDGAGRPLSAPGVRVRIEAEWADSQTRVLAVGLPVHGRVRLRLRAPADIAEYLYDDYPVKLRARFAGSARFIEAETPYRNVRLD